MNEGDKASDAELNDILCLQLHLDKGPINCGLDNDNRKRYIEEIYYEHYSYIENLNRVKKVNELAGEKSKFRIWVDNLPASLLGLYYICKEVSSYNVDVYVMDINVCVKERRKIFSWAQIDTEVMSDWLNKRRKISKNELNEYKNSWNKYVGSNLNLRSYINGSIVSLQENFFDSIILSEFCESKDITINEVIRNISEHYLACMDDYYIIYRIKHLVNKKHFI